MERPLDELEKLILRHLASGPCSASELADALRQYGVTPSRSAVTYRLGGLQVLKLVMGAEGKPRRGGGAEILYSLRATPSQAEPKATTEAAPPSVEVQAEPPKGTQVSPRATKGASKSPSNHRQDTPLTKAQLDARLALIAQRHRALLASGRIQGGHLR